MGVIGRVAGFAVGFALAAFGTLGLCTLYRGAWMPLALAGLAYLAFSLHPRLNKAPASGWLLATFAAGGLCVYMASVGRSPVRAYSYITDKSPYAVLAITLIAWFVFCRKNSSSSDKDYLYLPAAMSFLALGWVIVYFSGGSGGADPMVRLAMDRLGLTQGQAELLIVAVRKTAHFVWYGLVGLSAYRLANPKYDLKQAVTFGLQTALSFALYDEFRQSTATNRTGTFWDVGLDMLGATAFIGISVLRYRRSLQRDASS